MFFTDVRIEEQNGSPYLLATYKGKLQVRERILPLDAERFRLGDMPVESLLAKYCSYIKFN